MNESIRTIKDQLMNIEHENLILLSDHDLIADYCKQIRIELNKIDSQYNVSGTTEDEYGVHHETEVNGEFSCDVCKYSSMVNECPACKHCNEYYSWEHYYR